MTQPTPPFDLIGGAEPLRALVDRFYDLMDSDEAYAGIRALHPADMEGSREKLYMFLSGWTGGPQLYIERFGHPRLRARHISFPIGTSERDQWLACMKQAMQESGIGDSLLSQLLQAFSRTADFMRNQVE